MDVNTVQVTDAPILRQHRAFMSIKSFVQAKQLGEVTRDGVPMLGNPFNWHVAVH